ncbi:TPA: hypothetical protein U5D43_001720 [Yersinia enterocolitica]|uniref:DUF4297 family anti-phage-associated protein n=1 Tax=Yersinia enterocolitica TaxID=630 RepID=UPI0028B2AC0E|nr:hypothetical protein [Yersinia enterocolitica]HDM8092002.1 hypothetical protein [Yersinia enterocolitica]HEN3244829.1 hypothetical protein [Yersinia enterocolitica]
MTKAKRDAVDTLTGYFYQFDKTIIEALKKDGNTILTVEGIEDIDLNDGLSTTAVQCKYYSKQSYSPSTIKDAVTLMFEDFMSRKSKSEIPIKYFLYGNFKDGQDRFPKEITINYIKDSFLTKNKQVKKKNDKRDDTDEYETITIKTHEVLGATDNELIQFVESLIIDIDAPNYESQYAILISSLCTEFKCEEIEAEKYFYNNALCLIKKLSMEQLPENRKISKNEFIEKIDSKKLLFNIWSFAKLKRDKYIRFVKDEIRGSGFNANYQNTVYIFQGMESVTPSNLSLLVIGMVKKKSNKRKINGMHVYTYIYFHKIPTTTLLSVKDYLHQSDIRFNDGYPYFESSFKIEYLIMDNYRNSNPDLMIINSIEDLNKICLCNSRLLSIYDFHASSEGVKVSGNFPKNDIYINDPKVIKEVLL